MSSVVVFIATDDKPAGDKYEPEMSDGQGRVYEQGIHVSLTHETGAGLHVVYVAASNLERSDELLFTGKRVEENSVFEYKGQSEFPKIRIFHGIEMQ